MIYRKYLQYAGCKVRLFEREDRFVSGPSSSKGSLCTVFRIKKIHSIFYFLHVYSYGLINYKDTKAKCRHLKKLTCKMTLRQVFIRVYRLEMQSVMLVFSTHLVSCCPSPLLSCPTLSPIPASHDILHCLL